MPLDSLGDNDQSGTCLPLDRDLLKTGADSKRKTRNKSFSSKYNSHRAK